MLYRAGLSSKEGLQEHDSVDPILVVKFPRVLRGPPSALPPGRYLRSTWILREGQWHQLEDRAAMPDCPAKFDRYVERAVFQFHPVRGQLRPAAVSEASTILQCSVSESETIMRLHDGKSNIGLLHIWGPYNQDPAI